MRRPGEAVDAAMFTAAVRVYRAIETDIGRRIPTDRGSAGVTRQSGRQGRQRLDLAIFISHRAPAIVERHPCQAIEPHRGIDRGATAVPGKGTMTLYRRGLGRTGIGERSNGIPIGL